MKPSPFVRPLLLSATLTAVLAGCTTVVRPGPAVVDRPVPAPGPAVVEENVAYVRERPPPPRQEVIVRAPSPRHVWIPGRWVWRNGWDWQPGHWDLRPQPYARWQAGRWESRSRGWVWIEGGWR